jgi:hypothetical protein
MLEFGLPPFFPFSALAADCFSDWREWDSLPSATAASFFMA